MAAIRSADGGSPVELSRIRSTTGAFRPGATSRRGPPRRWPGGRNVSTFGAIDDALPPRTERRPERRRDVAPHVVRDAAAKAFPGRVDLILQAGVTLALAGTDDASEVPGPPEPDAAFQVARIDRNPRTSSCKSRLTAFPMRSSAFRVARLKSRPIAPGVYCLGIVALPRNLNRQNPQAAESRDADAAHAGARDDIRVLLFSDAGGDGARVSPAVMAWKRRPPVVPLGRRRHRKARPSE